MRHLAVDLYPDAMTTYDDVPIAWPYWICLGLVPIVLIAAIFGGWTIFLIPVITWWLFAFLDAVVGLDPRNPDPNTPEQSLFWHRAITLIWPFVQSAVLLFLLFWVAQTDHLSALEEILLFVGFGIPAGTIGIVYAHELIHQRTRLDAWFGDFLLAAVLYSHFRSAHLLVHHRYVGTPKDPITARYNEGFHAYYFRVLHQELRAAWQAETGRLAKLDRPWYDKGNPFWRYGTLQLVFVITSYLIAGWWGLLLFAIQATVAIWQLELVNYVEHYGLVRKHLGEGRYEPARLHHSWDATHLASNRLLINLQRHADHHARPDRPYPLLQDHGPEAVPQLPYAYVVSTILALYPRVWRRVMHPRLRAWRAWHYPEITDWAPYNTMSNPPPR